MKRIIEIIKISLILGTITGIVPTLCCGILFKIFGL